MSTSVVCQFCKADNCRYNDTCIKCDAKMIGSEVRVLDLTKELYEFINNNLEEPHPDDTEDIINAIHVIQNIMGTRIAKKLTQGLFK